MASPQEFPHGGVFLLGGSADTHRNGRLPLDYHSSHEVLVAFPHLVGPRGGRLLLMFRFPRRPSGFLNAHGGSPPIPLADARFGSPPGFHSNPDPAPCSVYTFFPSRFVLFWLLVWALFLFEIFAAAAVSFFHSFQRTECSCLT